MKSQWPECRCDLCLILHSQEARSRSSTEEEKKSVIVNKIVNISSSQEAVETPPPPTDEDKVDYSEYDYNDLDFYPIIGAY